MSQLQPHLIEELYNNSYYIHIKSLMTSCLYNTLKTMQSLWCTLPALKVYTNHSYVVWDMHGRKKSFKSCKGLTCPHSTYRSTSFVSRLSNPHLSVLVAVHPQLSSLSVVWQVKELLCQVEHQHQLTHHYSFRCEVFCTQVECGAENSEVINWLDGLG